ncbi:protein phosphatase 2C domain-containing protein [Microcoleus sp. LEGE 07076]|uniref:PP2C family serine/threonine-protein phosphatase n=1 Tax=Microcoleus sp. LEGE 07076 TaxID=915322 RepID=UPI0018824039|nr:PP2C family serine/threonine-protein phosphatase [Microcoleus sp. LEGE 07076]MBE9184936.1 protein phosphatase 2C domain-containing protein [Microcoleus sp. LEGE 07076]
MEWQVVGVSVQGSYHIDQKLPCQDAAKYETFSDNQIIIGAVSDGMGSARHSEIGSALAVNTALSEIKSRMCWQHQPSNEQVRDIFYTVLETVKASLKEEAEKKGYSLKDLACTLLIFVATPKWLAAMQVGDGLIVVRRSKGENYELLFRPDKGKRYPNETTPVTSSYAEREMQVDVKSGCYQFICAGTDGIENISLVKREAWRPFENFFKPLEEQIMLSQNTVNQKEMEIEDFLNSEQVNQETDDDKTLLLCVYSNFGIQRETQTETSAFDKDNREVATTQRCEVSSRPRTQARARLIDGLPHWSFDIAKVIVIALVMTLVCSLIQTHLPIFLWQLAYFIFNLTIISCVWFLRNGRY